MKNFIIYTGYVKNISPEKYANKSSQDFFNIWYKNTRDYTDNPIHIFGPDSPNIEKTTNTKILAEYENLGHVEDWNRKKGRWAGWVSGVLYGMIDAYVRRVDFICKEQDCLAFGDYINQMYLDLGNSGIILGNYSNMACAQSLFLVKRDHIPEVIKVICQDNSHLPEDTFSKIGNQKRLTFGYDRDRPFNAKDKRFYIQQVSVHDLDILIGENLIPGKNKPYRSILYL